jgi:glycerol uptake facilitator-like aquaporin
MAESDNRGFCEHAKISASKLLYEFMGTMLFTIVFLCNNSSSGRILISLWILTVFCWKISGSHFNPAVSVAYIFRRDSGGLSKYLAILYVIAQTLGAYTGGLISTWLEKELIPMHPTDQHYNNDNTFRAVMQETLGSFVFVFFFMTQTE